MKTIKINDREFTIEELNNLIEKAKKENPMQEVYEYHNTTEEEFNKKYKELPFHIKAYAKECLVVEYYNKGWKPNWNDSSESKYYPYFKMDDFSYYYWSYYSSSSLTASRLVFKNKKDLLEAVDKFIDVFEDSRLS